MWKKEFATFWGKWKLLEKTQRMNLERELHTIFAEKQTMKGEAIIFLASHSQTDEKWGKRGNGQGQGLFFFQLGVKQSKETAGVDKWGSVENQH